MRTEAHTVTVEVLTPVHVGTGESINALSYLREGNTLHVLDADRWLNWLEQQGKGDAYVRWVENSLSAGTQPASSGSRLTQFLTQKLGRTDVAQVAAQVRRYPVEMEECTEPDPSRGFRTHIRNARHRAYLPGSSIKGAIRTALLEDLLLEDDHLQNELLTPLQQVLGNTRTRQLRSDLRRCWQQMEQDLLRAGKRKANYDLLRFVMVSDSQPFSHDQVRVRRVRSEGTHRTTDTWLEMLTQGARTTFTLSFEPEAPLASLGLETGLGHYLRCDTLFEVLAKRAERRLERELKYAYPATPKQVIQELLEQNRNDAPLLCVGWGQGYLGTTVMGLVQDESAQDYSQLVLKMLPVLPRRGQGIEHGRFPKTRRTVRDRQSTSVAPLGWVQLRCQEG